AILGAGVRQLTASFRPNDTLNYKVVTGLTQSLTVNRALATVTLSNLVHTYDGTPKIASVTTSPAGLAVTTTYNGNTGGFGAGSYNVISTIADNNYVGSSTATMVVNKAAQTITFDPLADKTFHDPDFYLTAYATPSSSPVTFSVVSGPATVTLVPDGLQG